MVELMVQLRMSFASVHHFLEGKKGRDSKNEPNRNKNPQNKTKAKTKGGPIGAGRGRGMGKKAEGLQ